MDIELLSVRVLINTTEITRFCVIKDDRGGENEFPVEPGICLCNVNNSYLLSAVHPEFERAQWQSKFVKVSQEVRNPKISHSLDQNVVPSGLDSAFEPLRKQVRFGQPFQQFRTLLL